MPARRAVTTLTAAALACAAGVALAAPSQAANTAPVRITYAYWNSPGSDRGGNTSVNAEYITITNTTTSARSLTKWTLRDRANHVYTFPSFTLPAKASVKVRSGKGTATSTTRYYQSGWYIWNNDGDTAYLRDATGRTVSTCTWGSTGYKKSC